MAWAFTVPSAINPSITQIYYFLLIWEYSAVYIIIASSITGEAKKLRIRA